MCVCRTGLVDLAIQSRLLVGCMHACMHPTDQLADDLHGMHVQQQYFYAFIIPFTYLCKITAFQMIFNPCKLNKENIAKTNLNLKLVSENKINKLMNKTMGIQFHLLTIWIIVRICVQMRCLVMNTRKSSGFRRDVRV